MGVTCSDFHQLFDTHSGVVELVNKISKVIEKPKKPIFCPPFCFVVELATSGHSSGQPVVLQ